MLMEKNQEKMKEKKKRIQHDFNSFSEIIFISIYSIFIYVYIFFPFFGFVRGLFLQSYDLANFQMKTTKRGTKT